MSLTHALLLIIAGMFAGFLNVLAGGGSLLTLPLLIFMGLPPGVANASNRLGIILQNIFAVQGFKSKGVSVFPFAYWVALSACLGALLGSQIAVEIPDGLFNKILAIIMLLVMGVTVFKPGLSTNNIVEDFSKKRVWLSVVLFFFVGVYGGFIQAGVGFIMIAALSLVHSLPMARLNSIKVFVALCYTCVAVVVFIVNDMIRWDYGLTLAFGTAIGGWLTSRWSVTVPDKYVRGFLLVTVTALSIKLWFF